MRAFTIPVLIAVLVVAAPAPQPKIQYYQRNEIIGHWDIKWGSVDCSAEFRKDGNYYCSWATGVAIGGWYIKDRFLYVEEYQINSNRSLGTKTIWTVNLQRSNKCLKGNHNPSPFTVTTILMFRR